MVYCQAAAGRSQARRRRRAGNPGGRGKIELRRLEKTPTLVELVAQIARENRYPEMASGPTLGSEAVEC
ncbi:MAG: hypothetical protein DMG70_19300 [Acidobacteria bacterium]|nr:MAG: hypothetical protein DMG70_19300 [Acidobacteriota bacterium]PYY09302.1 MAG: hypothetical protein DMG69_10910 [Acidobacteriota bacterium]